MNNLAGLPATVGRYRVVSVLGHGGMGRVVKAHDPVLHRDVALKLVETASVDPAELTEVRFLFHREARAVAQLKHPNIIEVFDYSGADAELPFIACELLAAKTLREALDERGVALPASMAAAIAYELALALEHAHARDIIHRDVKPENVFWSSDGRVVLADFGIAKAVRRAERLGETLQHGVTNVYGSPAYMAAEQLQGQEADPRTDIHGLGVVLFEMLTGQPPYDGASVAAIVDAVNTGQRRALPQGIAPEPLVRLIDQMLATNPSERPAHARAVAERLRHALDSLNVSDPRLALTGRGDLTDRGDLPRASSARPVAPDSDATLVAQRAKPMSPRGSRWLVVALFTIAVSIGIAAGFYRRQLTTERKIPTPVVLYFDGSAELFVDGIPIGPAREPFRTELLSGKHYIEAKIYDSGKTLSKEIFVLPGIEAQFVLEDSTPFQ